MAQAEAQKLLETFKTSFYQEPTTDVDTCLAILPKIKIAVTQFTSMGVLQTDNVSIQETMLARAFLTHHHRTASAPPYVSSTSIRVLVHEIYRTFEGCLRIIKLGETYEYATLLSVKAADIAAFERHVAQAKTLYHDYR